MQNQGKDKQGRNWDQKTHDGTTSAGTMGTGATGESPTDKGYDEAAHTPWVGGMQTAGRTDDLLSDGSEADQNGQGFASGERTQDLLEGTSDLGSRSGSGSGNRQSQRQDQDQGQTQSLSGGGRPSDPTGLQGAAGNQGAAGIPGSADGNRQSGDLNQQGYGGERMTDVDRDQGSLAREGGQSRQSEHGSSTGAGSTAADQRDTYRQNPQGGSGDKSR
ncbi:hypothetical protein IP92_00652 [Pseudoduganella flava]|uniref:Uncharacterized protein n=1 Tax=Pseudoduganella flava TaxID=871742 RepID=A0A562Q4I5_9BURK|nr:hypothetical protein [Pseudoduganella flava]QGZ41672.1 hypothetical protein GO485_23185 [Pseudoduganella flava]TWI51665.1 hypothetical protein IP92_00652 [Pseudoduganella flava]